MKQKNYGNGTELAIRISWAINNAVHELSAKSDIKLEFDLVRRYAMKYLQLFDEMRDELTPICESCGGKESIIPHPNPIIDGIHKECREQENIKIKVAKQ